MRPLIPAALLVLVVLALPGCGLLPGSNPTITPSPVSPGGVVTGMANVERVEVLLLESFPVQIHVLVFGNLPDSCTHIDQVSQSRDKYTITVTLTTTRREDEVCSQALVPFQESVPLEAVGLKAGKYTVVVNGVSAEFELAVDNELVK